MSNIYESGAGDALLNPIVHTTAIRDYLEAERAFIQQHVSDYDALVETGCSAGRYAACALDSNKQYIGIDRVARYLAEGMRHYPRATFVAADIKNITGILPLYLQPSRKPLIVVPFNLVGTLAEPLQFLNELSATGHHFLLFSFNTDAAATEARAEYYTTSGFDDLHHHEEEDGVLFTSPSGLHSFAYTEAWFENAFRQLSVPLHKTAIGVIGTAYGNFRFF